LKYRWIGSLIDGVVVDFDKPATTSCVDVNMYIYIYIYVYIYVCMCMSVIYIYIYIVNLFGAPYYILNSKEYEIFQNGQVLTLTTLLTTLLTS
jgi:hypothetical protein